jgi:hypothetical protein
LRFGLRFLLRLQLLGRHPLALRLRRRLLLQVDVLIEFIEADGDAGHVEELFAFAVEERDFVFARSDPQREVLAFFVELQGVFAAGFHAHPLDRAGGDGLAFRIAGNALH